MDKKMNMVEFIKAYLNASEDVKEKIERILSGDQEYINELKASMDKDLEVSSSNT